MRAVEHAGLARGGLLDVFKASKILVGGIGIVSVLKMDMMRAPTMAEMAKELAGVLCFDVTVEREVERLAEMCVKLFKVDIYHLFDAFAAYNNEITEAQRKHAAPQATWPCRLRILCAFMKARPDHPRRGYPRRHETRDPVVWSHGPSFIALTAQTRILFLPMISHRRSTGG